VHRSVRDLQDQEHIKPSECHRAVHVSEVGCWVRFQPSWSFAQRPPRASASR
jgi:hypothetical protein